MRSRHAGRRALTLEEQVIRMRFTWPALNSRVTANKLVVRGQLRPTPLSDVYRVRVEYAIGDIPKAYVEAPELRPREDGGSIPHVYRGPRPCLYLPESGEWTNRKSLARTIIPWLMLWLTYYELWHATGVWQGGGVDHVSESFDGERLSITEASKIEPAPVGIEQMTSSKD